MPTNLWSDREVQILQEYYPRLPVAKMLPLLPSRTLNGVKRKAHMLSIYNISSSKPWTTQEIQILKDHYAHSIPKELCQLLPGRHHRTINQIARNLGLTKSPEARSRACAQSWLGKHHNPESKRKNAEAHKGKKPSNLAIFAYKGKIPWNKGKTGCQQSLNKGKTYEEIFGEEKAKQIKEHLAALNLGQKRSQEAIEKRVSKMRGDLNPSKRPEVKRKLSEARQKLLKNGWCHSPEAIEKIQLARAKQRIPSSKTKPELKFLEIVEEYNAPFTYTGDGTFWVGRLNPDFIHINHKKIAVEVFGEYWHTPLLNPSVRYEATETGRKKQYEKYGWRCIVFWAEPLMAKDGEQYALKLLGKEGIKCHSRGS